MIFEKQRKVAMLFGLLCILIDLVFAGPQSQPNVVVVLADDMRAGYTGHEGHPLIQTPYLDAFAARATVFSNAFATSAVCTPSRTSLLSGLYERRHGVNFNSRSCMTLEAFRQTYPMLLQDAGYFVGYVGKNHTPVGRNENGETGYKSGVMENQFDYWFAGHGHLTFYPKDVKKHTIFKNASADTQIEIIGEGVDYFMKPDGAFQAGQDFLQSRPKDQPFALLVNFNLPHGAGTGSMQLRESDPELYKTAYRHLKDRFDLPSTYISEANLTEAKIPQSVYKGEFISQYDYVKETNTLRERLIRTAQTITGIDRLFGKLLEQLEEQGVAENTIIVFTSDHGLLLGEFGLGGKVFLYEPSIRVPLIVFDPRIKKSERVAKSEELVALVDIAPTLLELTGTPIPPDMQGLSLKPLLWGHPFQWRQELFLENMMTIQNYPRMEGVRTKKWKYIRYFDREKNAPYNQMINASINGELPIYEELYNLQHDPEERQNVISDPVNSSILTGLRLKNSELVARFRGEGPLQTHVYEKH